MRGNHDAFIPGPRDASTLLGIGAASVAIGAVLAFRAADPAVLVSLSTAQLLGIVSLVLCPAVTASALAIERRCGSKSTVAHERADAPRRQRRKPSPRVTIHAPAPRDPRSRTPRCVVRDDHADAERRRAPGRDLGRAA